MFDVVRIEKKVTKPRLFPLRVWIVNGLLNQVRTTKCLNKILHDMFP